MGIHKNLDALATKYVNYISKYSSIDERELNLVQQLVYAKIKQEFFSLKYEHILLEDKIGELALLIAYTKIAQNKSNVNHLLVESEFAENKCPKKFVNSETKKLLSSHQSASHASQLPGHSYGREAGQLQQQQMGLHLGYQAEHHPLALHVSKLP